VERLDTFPENGEVDLTNVVTYPPKLQPIPVKPIFLDIAWNYIDYPGRTPVKPVIDGDTPMQEAPASEGQPPPQQQKRGWFGFGR
jgi:signal recognition particle subunit SRP68